MALTLDGQYDRDLTGASGHITAWVPSLLVFPKYNRSTGKISFGIAAGLNNYWGVVTPDPLWAGSVDGFIRLMPWGIQQDHFNSYILLGGGLNPLNGSSFLGFGSWAGSYHFMGQVGLRYIFDPNLAIDAGVGSDYFSPFPTPW